MPEQQILADRFESQRARLLGMASRMLGSSSQAEDAVQEAWLRLNRSEPGIDNLDGWLTTVTGRICLDMLRARRRRPEDPIEEPTPAAASIQTAHSPEDEAVLADSLGTALQVVLDTLGPDERLAFVLHDMFGVSFDQIGAILDRPAVSARQLASRARRKVRRDPALPDDRGAPHHQLVAAFLAASRAGDFEALLHMLHPQAVMRADAAVVALGAPAEVAGAAAMAKVFSGGAKVAMLTLVDGLPGLVWSMGGKPKVVFEFTISDGVITRIDQLGEAAVLSGLELERLAQPPRR